MDTLEVLLKFMQVPLVVAGVILTLYFLGSVGSVAFPDESFGPPAEELEPSKIVDRTVKMSTAVVAVYIFLLGVKEALEGFQKLM